MVDWLQVGCRWPLALTWGQTKLVGWLVGPNGWLVVWLVGWFVGWLVGWLVGLVGWLGWLVGWFLVCWFVLVGLVVWLV